MQQEETRHQNDNSLRACVSQLHERHTRTPVTSLIKWLSAREDPD